MAWRGIAAKVLVFVMGAAGVVLAVFVVAPWLEAPDQPAVHPPSRDAVVEGALASFGEADGEAVEAAGVAVVPSPLLAAGVDNPVPGPAMDVPADVPDDPDAAAAQSTGLPEVLSPQEAARVASAPHVETDDGPLAVEAERIPEPMPAAPETAKATPREADEAPAPIAAETVEAATQAPPAPAVSELVEAEEPARSETETGPQRVVLEEPDGARVAEMSLGAEAPPPETEPIASAIKPLSEFSPRSFSRSDTLLAAETLDSSSGPSEATARGAGQAGPPYPGLPPPSDPVVVPGTLRGVMGYRMPLVSRQALPDQVVSGVLIPAHTTYVILQPGYWELIGLTPDEVNVLQMAAEKTKADEPAARSEPPARGWNPFRRFRRNRTPANGE